MFHDINQRPSTIQLLGSPIGFSEKNTKWGQTTKSWMFNMDIICNYMVNMVYAADRTRTLFQPSQVHFSWVFQVCCASALFFDPSKSCDELLRFVIFFASDFQVVVFSSFEDLGQIFIYIFRCRGLRPQSVQPLL